MFGFEIRSVPSKGILAPVAPNNKLWAAVKPNETLHAFWETEYGVEIWRDVPATQYVG
jgi:hypothetical protein